MRVHIYYIIRGVVVEIILTAYAVCTVCGVEIPVHCEVDDVQAGEVGMVRCVVIVAVKPCVVAFAEYGVGMAHVILG